MTLRYAYGAAHPAAIRALVARYRRARAPLARSQAAWRRWLPQETLGAGRSWLSRELQWNAYLLRSGTTYDEGCGAHLLSQGGYYQYDLGVNAAYRAPPARPAARLRRAGDRPRGRALLGRRATTRRRLHPLRRG